MSSLLSICNVFALGLLCIVPAQTNHATRHIQSRVISKRQTTKNVCTIPEPIEHGNYHTHPRLCPAEDKSDACKLVPGSSVPDLWVLYATCQQGYQLSRQSNSTLCRNGQWRPAPPTCILQTRHTSQEDTNKPDVLNSEEKKPDYNESCFIPEPMEHGSYRTHPRLCPTGVDSDACKLVPGTKVPSPWLLFYSCHPGYKLSRYQSESLCRKGTWKPALPTCIPAVNLIPESDWKRTSLGVGVSNSSVSAFFNQVTIEHTGKRTCSRYSECIDAVLETENDHINRLYGGIRYNFLVGGDGSVFEGLGWDKVLPVWPAYNSNNGSISIGLIGNFTEMTIPEAMLVATTRLIDYGVSLGKISKDYKLYTLCEEALTKGSWCDSQGKTFLLTGITKCPKRGFRCSDKSCLEISMKCTSYNPGSSGQTRPDQSTPTAGACKLPEQPDHGSYIAPLCRPGDSRTECQSTPGTLVPSNWLLKYSCVAKYDLTSDESDFSVCDNGLWKNPLDCIKLCQPLLSLSVNVRCELGGQEVSCEKSMRPQTRATPRCRPHYKEAYIPRYSTLQCMDDGEWSNHLFYCIPDCGISNHSKSLHALISNGRPTLQGEFPWLAAIYLRNMDGGSDDKWAQQCGGTLISPHIVLTAAHCLIETDGTPYEVQDIKVGLGKYFRDFYRMENYSVICDVRETKFPQHYSGLASNYALDIGLIDLVDSVQVTTFIMPACFDWTSKIKIKHDLIGLVAGWGTTENSVPSKSILSSQLAYIDHSECLKRVQLRYKGYITHDKFCAGSINGSQVDKGDSGGGLTIVKDGQHFVVGVVSTKMTDETSFALFTDVMNPEHFSWLEEQRNHLDTFHYDN